MAVLWALLVGPLRCSHLVVELGPLEVHPVQVCVCVCVRVRVRVRVRVYR